MEKKLKSITLAFALGALAHPAALQADPKKTAMDVSIGAKGYIIEGGGNLRAGGLGGELDLRSRLYDIAPKNVVQAAFIESGKVSLYGTSDNYAPDNLLAPKDQGHGTFEIGARAAFALSPRPLFSITRGCGAFIAPGVQGDARVTTDNSRPGLNDKGRFSANIEIGPGCVGLNSDSIMLLTAIGKASVGNSTYGLTQGTSAGGRLSFQSKDLAIETELTHTLTGSEEGGSATNVSYLVAVKPTKQSQIGVQYNLASISGRDTSKDAAGAAIGSDVIVQEVKAAAGLAW